MTARSEYRKYYSLLRRHLSQIGYADKGGKFSVVFPPKSGLPGMLRTMIAQATALSGKDYDDLFDRAIAEEINRDAVHNTILIIYRRRTSYLRRRYLDSQPLGKSKRYKE